MSGSVFPYERGAGDALNGVGGSATPQSTSPARHGRFVIHRCPECGDTYIARSPRWQRLLADSPMWCSGPSTGAPRHEKPVACEPLEVAEVSPQRKGGSA